MCHCRNLKKYGHPEKTLDISNGQDLNEELEETSDWSKRDTIVKCYPQSEISEIQDT